MPMDTKHIISLRGKEQCGVAYITAGGDRTLVKIKPHGGIGLEGATVYCLTAAGASEGTLDALFSAQIKLAGDISAVFVAKQPGGPFIMEGSVRGAQLDMEQVKRELRMRAMNKQDAARVHEDEAGHEAFKPSEDGAQKDARAPFPPKNAAAPQQKKGAAARPAQKESSASQSGTRPANANRAAKGDSGPSANAAPNQNPPPLPAKPPGSAGKGAANRLPTSHAGSTSVFDKTRGRPRKPEDLVTYAVVDEKEQPLYPPGAIVPLYEEAKGGSDALNNIMSKARELFIDPDQQPGGNQQRRPDNTAPRIKRVNQEPPAKRRDEQWLKETEDLLNGRKSVKRQNPPCAVMFDGVGRTEPAYNPFPDAFPRSVWKRVSYPGSRHYYMEGEAMKDGARFIIHAIPGEFSSQAPLRHKGFTRFMRAADGVGYWLRIRRRD